MTPIITTFTNRRVNPLDVHWDDINIQDIAHALACCNRFAGHVKEPISVAQHSVYVSRYVESGARAAGVDEDKVKMLALQGLLHDASEAYLGDVTKWLKSSPAFHEYREAEATVQARIFDKFSVPNVQHPLVTEADEVMVRYEAAQGGLDIGYGEVTDQQSAVIGTWVFWSWDLSEKMFLRTFDRLYHGVSR